MMRFQAGNVHAYELLCERYRTPVFAYLYRMLEGDRGSAEDLLQEVLVKVAGAARFYEPRAKFSTWLFTIARNHGHNYLKSRAYRQDRTTVSIDAEAAGDSPSRAAAEPAGTGDTRRDVEGRETTAILEAAIQRLPEEYREVFVLRAVHGISHEESARILDRNPATVRTQYSRARERLRAEIGPRLDLRPRGSGGGMLA